MKLIAEPWDLGLYMVGSFPNWDVWCEWNGRFRDDVRRFIRGDGAMKQAFATRLAGSADLYHVNDRRPEQGINFVIAHDGFTLADAVAYNEKHNEDNGEFNRALGLGLGWGWERRKVGVCGNVRHVTGWKWNAAQFCRSEEWPCAHCTHLHRTWTHAPEPGPCSRSDRCAQHRRRTRTLRASRRRRDERQLHVELRRGGRD